MRKRSTITKNSLQLVMGMIVSLFLISQTPLAPTTSIDNEDAKEQAANDADAGATEQVQLREAVPTPLPQINLGFQSVLLQEVVMLEELAVNHAVIKQVVPATQKALKVILSRIIAPNAP